MKKLLAVLLALLSGKVVATDNAKLGSESDPIRQMLFASQSLKEQTSRIHSDGTQGPYQMLLEAEQLVVAGKKNDAVRQLYNVLKMPDLETRTILWTWTALRELGEKPDPKFAYEVLGAVIEMPSGDAYDTLASYVDGSARYLNFSGRAIFWDAKEDVIVKALCQSLIDSTVPVSTRAKPRKNLSLPKRGAQVTLLTRSGNFVIHDPPDSVVGPAAALMMELMKRSKDQEKSTGN